MSVELELERIRKENRGTLTAEAVVEYAKSHKSSALHARFDWSTERAAYEHWLSVARQIIKVHFQVIDRGDGQKEPMRAYVHVGKKTRGGYLETKKVLSNTDSRRALIRQQLDRIESAYRSYPVPELDPIRDAIALCREALKATRLPEAAE